MNPYFKQTFDHVLQTFDSLVEGYQSEQITFQELDSYWKFVNCAIREFHWDQHEYGKRLSELNRRFKAIERLQPCIPHNKLSPTVSVFI